MKKLRKWGDALRLWWEEDPGGMRGTYLFTVAFCSILALGLLYFVLQIESWSWAKVFGLSLAVFFVTLLPIMPLTKEAIERIEREEKRKRHKAEAQARRERLACLAGKALNLVVDPSNVSIVSGKVSFSLIRISLNGVGETTLLIANDALVVGGTHC